MSRASDSGIHDDTPAAASPTGFGDRKELGAVAFERTRMPMVVADARQPDYPIVLANKAFLDLTGYSADEVLGRNCRFLQGGSTSRTAIAELHVAIAEGREADVELLNYRKDGSAFWNQLHLSPIRDDSGQIAYFFASQMNVTEQRKVQILKASEHRLLMEVDHRAKNVLAVVDSFVRLSRSDDPERFAAVVQQRIQALSKAHSLLSESGWKGISLHRLIDEQIAPYRTGPIAMQGPEIIVAPEMVQPLSLVIHELIVNAAAHGALATPKGRLEVAWARISEAGGFHMTWTEAGASPQDQNAKPGFGTVMMKAMVETQLSGRLEREWRDDGLRLSLDIPASELGSD